jgi:hypothetical protein
MEHIGATLVGAGSCSERGCARDHGAQSNGSLKSISGKHLVKLISGKSSGKFGKECLGKLRYCSFRGSSEFNKVKGSRKLALFLLLVDKC